MSDTRKLAPGTEVGRYRIQECLGEGGMATIYLASSEGPGGFTKNVALKLLRPDFSEEQQVSDLLLHEARVSALLHHQNIVQVFDLGQHGADYYMTMEWVDGMSLAGLLRTMWRAKVRLPVHIGVHIARCVAEALDYLRRGVLIDGKIVQLIHRDVSPSNILLSNDGSVKLTDFGIVKVLEAPSMTKVGVVKGKYAYMSPEQIRGDAVDHRSDIFSLGVVLFEAIAGRRLFHRKTLAATVAAVHAAKVLPPSVFNGDVDPGLDRVVAGALASDREERFETAALMAEVLAPFTRSDAQEHLAELVQNYQDQAGARGPIRASRRPLTQDLVLKATDDDDNLPDLRREEFAELENLASEIQFDDGSSQDSDPTRRVHSSVLAAAVDPEVVVKPVYSDEPTSLGMNSSPDLRHKEPSLLIPVLLFVASAVATWLALGLLGN